MSELVKTEAPPLARPTGPIFHMEGEDKQDVTIPLAHLYQDSAKERQVFGSGYNLGDLINIVTLQPMTATKFCVIDGYIDFADQRKDSPVRVSRSAADWPEADHAFADRGDGKPPHPYVTRRMNFLVLFEGEDWPVILRFKKTSIQAGRNLNMMLKMQSSKGTVGLYEYLVKPGNSDKGAYVVPQIKLLGAAPADMAEHVRSIRESLSGKSVTVEEGAVGTEGGNDDESPF